MLIELAAETLGARQHGDEKSSGPAKIPVCFLLSVDTEKHNSLVEIINLFVNDASRETIALRK